MLIFFINEILSFKFSRFNINIKQTLNSIILKFKIYLKNKNKMFYLSGQRASPTQENGPRINFNFLLFKTLKRAFII